MSEIKYLSRCTDAEQQAAFQFYLTSFAYYKIEYDEEKQRALIDHLIQSEWCDALIYFELDVPLGFCFFTKTYSSRLASMCLKIEDLFVAREFRNKGIGTQILQSLLKHCEQNEILQLLLIADTGVTGSVGFYERLGFNSLENTIPMYRMTFNDREF